jgi:hypothetical protein
MYTEEDVKNLAEFLYLGHMQFYWENFKLRVYPYKELEPVTRSAWESTARVALEFKQSHNIQ